MKERETEKQIGIVGQYRHEGRKANLLEYVKIATPIYLSIYRYHVISIHPYPYYVTFPFPLFFLIEATKE